MSKIHLNVPYVSQVNIGGHIEGEEGRTERMGCWYAAACMLGYFRENGPRLGMPSQYLTSNGLPRLIGGTLQPAAMGKNTPELAANEGWKQLPLPQDKAWTCEQLITILQKCGPCYMRTKSSPTVGHILVLVGADSDAKTVTVHDPARGPNRTFPIDDLNRIFKWDGERARYSMMYKPAP